MNFFQKHSLNNEIIKKMKNIENKKIPVVILLFSIIGIMIGYLIKNVYNNDGSLYVISLKYNYPLSWYEIYAFGYLIEYTTFLSVMLMILGLGIYSFLFKTDEEIKIGLNKFKNCFKKIKSNQNINNSLANFKNQLQKIKTSSAFKSVKKQTKDFYSIGEGNKIINIEESKVEKEIEDKEYWIEKFFNYDGRINRTDFFWRTLLFSFIFYVIINKIMDKPYEETFSVFSSVFLILLILFNFGIKTKIKRLHDINLSGWICLAPFILEVSLIISLIFKSYISTDFGLASIFLFVGIVPLFNILLLSIPGSKSKNKFG
jgi:uncharacterized membrane protein YhaH (DUF805 family)